MKALFAIFEGNKTNIYFVLRLVTAAIIIWAGYRKFNTGMGGVEAWFMAKGIFLPKIMAWAVALIELVGGIALLVGIFTREIALLMTGQFLAITFYYHIALGNGGLKGGQLSLMIALVTLLIVAKGPGPLSLDKMVLKRD